MRLEFLSTTILAAGFVWSCLGVSAWVFPLGTLTRRPQTDVWSTVSANKRSNAAPSEFSFVDDDDDDDEYDDDSYAYIPPEFDVIDSDEDEVAEPLSSSRTTIPQAEEATRDKKQNEKPTWDNDYEEEEMPRKRSSVKRPKRPTMGVRASWMERNAEFSHDDAVAPEPQSASFNPRDGGRQNEATNDRPNQTFRRDFRGTRVFVQGLPPDASWQDVKDHFKEAGTVIFASVSVDPRTGESKGHGIVQYETTEMAQTAIAIMRNYPMNGYKLFVRQDVQEAKQGAELKGRAPREGRSTTSVPTRWKCADEENASFLSESDKTTVVSMIQARDDARRRRQYDVSDRMRDELKTVCGVHLDDRLKMWWTSMDGKQVPKVLQEIKGEGRWGLKPWRQIPTTPENDACVNADLVNALLNQRDIARREKDFSTADALLEEARTSPDGDLNLRIHDESRTWRIWTEAPPPRPVSHNESLSPEEQCLALVKEFAPEKADEVSLMLSKFPGREWQILKKLRQRYIQDQ